VKGITVEPLILLGAGLVLLVVGGSVCGIIALSKLAGVERMLKAVEKGHDLLRARLRSIERARESALPKAPAPVTPDDDIEIIAVGPGPKDTAPADAPTPVSPSSQKPEPPIPADGIPEKVDADAGASGGESRATPEGLTGDRLRAARERREASAKTPDALAVAQAKWKQFEKNIGKQWIAWVGALILFVSAALFVKLAVDNDWIGVTGRILMGIAFGLALLVAGDRFLRRTYRGLGQGLVGAGLAVLYVSLFYSCGRVVPQEIAFGLMVLVTAAGMTLAVLHDAVAIGFIAVLGGLLSPLLVSTGKDSRDALFTYLMFLDLGVLGVAFYKKWRALDVLAFLGTWGLYAGWYGSYRYAETFSLVPTLLWLAVFYLVFLVLPFVYHLRFRVTVPLERFVLSLANAVVAFAHAYAMLKEEHTYVLGFVALGMAASYLVLSTYTRRRIATDTRALFGFVAMAVVFLTLAIPLHLKMHGITLSWAIEGPVLLYLGYRFRYFPARALAMAVLACAVVYLFARHWPIHEMAFVPVFNVRYASAMLVPLSCAAFALVHHWKRVDSEDGDRRLKTAAAIAGAFIALVVTSAEIALSFEFTDMSASDEDHATNASVALLWIVGAGAFLASGIRLKSKAARVSGLVAVFVAGISALLLYGDRIGHEHVLFLNTRFAVSVAIVLVYFAYFYALRRWREICGEGEQKLAMVLGGIGLFLLWLVLTSEVYSYATDVVRPREKGKWVGQMAVSIVWGLYAISLLAIGFWKKMRPLRFIGLGLFGLTALKLVFVDMAAVEQVFRIVSFLVLGLLMIGTSYLYHRVEKWLEASTGGASEETRTKRLHKADKETSDESSEEASDQ
jgi:uncharacterized membrane protein